MGQDHRIRKEPNTFDDNQTTASVSPQCATGLGSCSIPSCDPGVNKHVMGGLLPTTDPGPADHPRANTRASTKSSFCVLSACSILDKALGPLVIFREPTTEITKTVRSWTLGWREISRLRYAWLPFLRFQLPVISHTLKISQVLTLTNFFPFEFPSFHVCVYVYVQCVSI